MIDRVVVLLLVGCALFGGVIVVELTSDAGTSASERVAMRPKPPVPPRVQGPPSDELLSTILARPLFSLTRQPAAHASPDQPAGLDLAQVRLTGIVIEPGRHLAIFVVPGSKPMVLSEGETMKDWRLDSITRQAVVLSGPAGTRTLQPKIDANLVRRAPTPPPPAQKPPPAAPGAPAGAHPGVAGVVAPSPWGATTPAPPGAAVPKPAAMPAVAPPGTPMPSLRIPGAARGRE
jgi:hypothetical protein